MQKALNHILWLGGASGAAKSTTTQHLAKTYGLTVYDTDERMGDHARRASARGDCPLLDQFLAMSMDQRWVDRAPQEMLESFHWYCGEGFDLIVEDLMAMPRDQRILVEGFRLLPHLVQPLIGSSSQALWLIPTPAFRQSAFEARGTTWEIAHQTSNPQVALQNLLTRDALFGLRLTKQLDGSGLPYLEVDGARSEAQLMNDVATHFQLQNDD